MQDHSLRKEFTIQNMPFLVWIAAGHDLRVIECSQRLLNICDQPDSSLIGKSLSALIGEAELAALESWTRETKPMISALSLRGFLREKNGTELPVDFEVARIAGNDDPTLVFFARERHIADGTESAMNAGDQGKLDALAIVAEGIGHEINNPLQIIMGNAEQMMLSNKNTELASYLWEILAASERIKSVVANLKNFVRPHEK
jgi:nitrogen-specific signal transduction histidine kinase